MGGASMQIAGLPCSSKWTRFQALGVSRQQGLEQLDRELAKGDERSALSLAKSLQSSSVGGLSCFGSARQVPQRLYSLDELKLNGINPSALLSPVDETLGSVERNLQLAAIAGGVSIWKAFSFSPQEMFYLSVGLLFLWTLDVVSFNGGFSSLVLDTIGHTLSQKYHNRVIQHEAGHFLVAYLLGILPKGYTLSSLEAFQKEGSLNVQAGTSFVDFEFLEEVSKHFGFKKQFCKTVLETHLLKNIDYYYPNQICFEKLGLTLNFTQINSGKVSATMVDRFSCIALAGVATEYLQYGLAEGGLADINKLDLLLKSLGFTQKKADSQVRWSVLNTVFILRRHELARSKLAYAISSGKSVGSCIAVIEDAVNIDDI